MTKFTQKFNQAYTRFAFWQTLTAMLADFDSMVKRREYLTPQDVKAQKRIHRDLYGCYTLAKKMREQHRNSLDRMIRKGDNT